MQITAAVFRDATLKPSFETLDLTGPGPGEVLVRMVATGVCHADAKAAGPESLSPGPSCWATRAQAWWRLWGRASRKSRPAIMW